MELGLARAPFFFTNLNGAHKIHYQFQPIARGQHHCSILKSVAASFLLGWAVTVTPGERSNLGTFWVISALGTAKLNIVY